MSQLDQTQRTEYVMSDQEWRDRGGCAPPTERGPWRLDAIDAQGKKRGAHLFLHSGPTGVPVDGNVLPKLLALAETHGVEPLSIHWPDIHYPEFTAIPKDA